MTILSRQSKREKQSQSGTAVRQAFNTATVEQSEDLLSCPVRRTCLYLFYGAYLDYSSCLTVN